MNSWGANEHAWTEIFTKIQTETCLLNLIFIAFLPKVAWQNISWLHGTANARMVYIYLCHSRFNVFFCHVTNVHYKGCLKQKNVSQGLVAAFGNVIEL